MKWYSEEELKKWCGHSITLPLLEQMKCKNIRICDKCRYWQTFNNSNENGFCKLLHLSGIYSFTYYNTECKQGFVQ